MNIEEYKVAIKERPSLAILLASLYKKDLFERATLYRPGEAGEQYNNFCDKLKLKEKPYLLVVDDDVRTFKNEDGIYNAFSNSVAVPRSIFEAFQSEDTYGSYVVAHELGHAKFAQDHSRRKFLGYGASIAAGLITGGLTRKGVDSILRAAEKTYPEKTQREKKTTPSILKALGRQGAFIGAGWFSQRKIMHLLARAEEFQADQYAKELVPARDIIDVMITRLEKGLEEIHLSEELTAAKKQFAEVIARQEKAGHTIPDTAKSIAWALLLSEGVMQKMTLKEIIMGDYYPKFQETLQRLARSESVRSHGRS